VDKNNTHLLYIEQEIQEAFVGVSDASAVAANDAAGGTLFTTVAGFIGRIMSALGSNIVGYSRQVAGAVAGTVYSKLFQHVSVRDFGAVGDGVTLDTAAVAAAIAYAKANGYTRIYFPKGCYLISNLLIKDLSGFILFGDGATYKLDPTKGTVIRFAGSSGYSVLFDSCSSFEVKDIWFSYTSAAFTGDLVQLDNTAGLDTNSGEFTRCMFSGETAAAANCTNLLRPKKCYQIDATSCLFLRGGVGVGIYSYTNILNIRRCQFQGITYKPIYAYTGSIECINIYMNTFEPRSNGMAAAFDAAPAVYVFSMSYMSNWHGDVGTAGGGAWLRLTGCRGLEVAGNTFGQSGGGTDDYALDLNECNGVSIHGNHCEDKFIKFSGQCLGGDVYGNNVGVDIIKNPQYAVNFSFRNNNGLASSNWRARVYSTTNQLLTASTYSPVLFGAEFYDTANIHSTTVNTSRLTVPAYGGTSTVRLLFGFTLGAANGKAFVQIRKNGGTIVAQLRVPLDTVDNVIGQIAVEDTCVAGDFYELYINPSVGIPVVGGAYAASDTFGSISRINTGD